MGFAPFLLPILPSSALGSGATLGLEGLPPIQNKKGKKIKIIIIIILFLANRTKL
jgi:hypothetical protein